MNFVPQKSETDYECLYREPFLPLRGMRRILGSGSLFMMLCGRLGEGSGVRHRIFRRFFILLSRRRGVEIDYSDKIGGGLIMAHAYNIAVKYGDKDFWPGVVVQGLHVRWHTQWQTARRSDAR